MSSVKLYVYDLSNGMARNMSLQLTGRQIDGIWHTSIVAYGMEVFYGQGISITAPGKSHHGTPLQVVDMGETAIDRDTFQEYLAEMREHYTADKYHLLDFNCNSFTNDVLGFLTGGSIPSYIKDLPSDFLSTPFGAALRPTIDAMYRRPGAGPIPSGSAQPQASSLLNNVASQASGPQQTNGVSSIEGPIQVSTNPASFHSILQRHKAVAAFFTSATCAPCKIVEPVFDDLARDRASGGVAFTRVDIDSGMGNAIAGEFRVSATPTFLFFIDGIKTGEVKGADAAELRSQVDLMIFTAFPPHPHTSLDLPRVRGISLQPILYSQVPAIDAALSKMISFVGSYPDITNKPHVLAILSTEIAPFLKQRFPKDAPPPKSHIKTPVAKWIDVTNTLVKTLPAPELFPLVDFWRLAVLDNTFAKETSFQHSLDPIRLLLEKSKESLNLTPNPRNFFLTVLRLLSNVFSCVELARHLLSASLRDLLSSTLIPSLLHADASVRSAAASLAFNVAAHYQRPLVEQQRNAKKGEALPDAGNGDWEVELVSALIEAIDTEKQNEEVVHRLVASLGILLHLSPFFVEQLQPLIEVLQAKSILKSKLSAGGFSEKGVTKAPVKALITEVAEKLC
ncbi:DUF862-domain-containing protein [Sistotremastrum niveocremeum HHB9708]|uniref:DUF862-domain-containing protein n=1 Tax=Sistotremastrum niveocremeum HHB9708 TaxID=1314777 RepID=A0A164RE06_9AGAM|nr:DUF862-domain-containing protein [Sistotremastrum niveocremeum HHB9708]